MKILITSKNDAKNEGALLAFQKSFPETEIEIVKEGFPSNIKDQPTSQEEGIWGAINRVKNGRNQYSDIDFDYFVGLEGYVYTDQFGMFLAGTVVIMNRDGIKGIGHSPAIQIPNFIKNRIENGEELGPIIQELMNDESNNIRHSSGTHGILTGGLYLRSEEFYHATLMAIARFTSSLYSK